MKPGSKLLAIALLFVGLVLVNYLASSLPVRVDATAESIYSLSPGTKAMLAKIEEPVTIDFYFSKDTANLPIAIKNYAARVQEMLRQYVRASRGKIILNVVNPRADTPEEERATAAGLTPAPLSNGDQLFFGVVVTQADQQKSIATLLGADPQRPFGRESFLEYDISKLVYSVQQFDKPKLGLLTSLPLQGTNPQEAQMMAMMGRRPQPSQFVISEWEQSFQIVPVDAAATELPANLTALVVVHPQNVSPKLQFAIDQFLLSGKPVLLAVDPASYFFRRQSQNNQQAMMMGAAAPNVTSDLPALLSAYGIDYNPQPVVGDLENPLTVGGPNGQPVRMVTWLSLQAPNFNAQALPTAQLKSLWFVDAGALAPKAGSTLTFTPLVETSAESGTADGTLLGFLQGDQAARQITPSGKKTIAAMVTGKFKTAFPNGAPTDAPKPAEQKEGKDAAPSSTPPANTPAESLKESKTTSTLVVVADSDWLLDDFSVQKIPFLGQVAVQPYNDNLAFASNTAEFLGGSQDLISIRTKGSSLRQFEVTRKMEAEAQKKYQEKLTALEARLSDVQKKLSEMQGKKTEGNRLIATPEMAKAIEEFQKQQGALRGEIREIRRALREDIDALENRLLVVNLLATPLLVGAFGVWFYRSRKK